MTNAKNPYISVPVSFAIHAHVTKTFMPYNPKQANRFRLYLFEINRCNAKLTCKAITKIKESPSMALSYAKAFDRLNNMIDRDVAALIKKFRILARTGIASSKKISTG